MCGLFYFGGRVGVGIGHGFAAFPEEGGLCSPPMSHGRETSNVCKHPQPSLCFLVLHPSPHLCRLNPPEKNQMLSLKAKAEAVFYHHLRWKAAKRREGSTLVSGFQHVRGRTGPYIGCICLQIRT